MSDSNIIFFYLWFLLSKYPEKFIWHDQWISHSRYSRKSIPTLCWQISKEKDGQIHISSSDNKSVSHWITFDYFFHV
jgi:hypothetical protein